MNSTKYRMPTIFGNWVVVCAISFTASVSGQDGQFGTRGMGTGNAQLKQEFRDAAYEEYVRRADYLVGAHAGIKAIELISVGVKREGGGIEVEEMLEVHWCNIPREEVLQGIMWLDRTTGEWISGTGPWESRDNARSKGGENRRVWDEYGDEPVETAVEALDVGMLAYHAKNIGKGNDAAKVVRAKIQHGIERVLGYSIVGFASTGDKVWEVRFVGVEEKEVLYACALVHATSGVLRWVIPPGGTTEVADAN